MVRNSPRFLSILVGGAAALLVAACGGKNGNGQQPGPCDGAMPAPECSTTCSGDAQCSAGFYCDTGAGTCTADCTQGGSECGSDATCDPNGHCVPTNNGCPAIDVDLTPVVPIVVLLIDQSGSMDEGFGNNLSRWEAVKFALDDQQMGALPKLDGQIDVGATLYTSENGNDGPTCPELTSVPVAPNNSAAIAQLLDDNDPVDDTPTAEAITAVTAGFPSDGNRPRILVLATDGEPDTCVDPDASGAGPEGGSENAVAAAYQAGITTYVLSVGNDVGATHLQHLANLGQGMPADGPIMPVVANNPQELVDAFGQIIGGVRSCDISVNGTVDLDKASGGTVILNGNTLMYGTDWTMKDPMTVELLGAACDEYLSSNPVMLSGQFPCGGVIID